MLARADTETRLHSIKSSEKLAQALATHYDAFNVERASGFLFPSPRTVPSHANIGSPEREQREMLQSFGEIDPRRNQSAGEDLRKNLPTGSWFTGGADFQEWLSTKNSSLLLTGIRKKIITLSHPYVM